MFWTFAIEAFLIIFLFKAVYVTERNRRGILKGNSVQPQNFFPLWAVPITLKTSIKRSHYSDPKFLKFRETQVLESWSLVWLDKWSWSVCSVHKVLFLIGLCISKMRNVKMANSASTECKAGESLGREGWVHPSCHLTFWILSVSLYFSLNIQTCIHAIISQEESSPWLG